MTGQEFYEKCIQVYGRVNIDMEQLLDSLEEQDKFIEELKSFDSFNLPDEQTKEILDMLNYSVELAECLEKYI